MGVGLFEELAALVRQLVAEAGLVVDEGIHARLEPGERLLALDRRGAGNDQGRPGLVDQDRIDLVHDAIVVVALDLVLLAGGHAVVAEVVEAELARGAVGDVAAVHFPAQIGRHLLLDAAEADAEEGIKVAHPLRVAPGEVVVDRHELGVPARQGIEVERQRRDQRLALARGHLRDLALMEGDPADQLDVEMDHVPGQLVLADQDLPAKEAAGAIFDRGEGFGQDLVEGLAVFQAGHELIGLGAQLLVGQRLVGLFEFVDPNDDRPGRGQELFIVPTGKMFEDERQHERWKS